MTEYDYSPEAYDHYIQTQDRIAQWVRQTEEHRPDFSQGGPGQTRGRPSFLQRFSHRQRSFSAHEPHRPPGPSSSSSSSSSSGPELYSDSHLSPGAMPAPAYQNMYPQQQGAPPVSAYYHPKHSSRHRSSHHRSSHRSPEYVIAQPISPPPQPYPYQHGMTTRSGQALSPGLYSYPAKAGASTVSSPSYIQPSAPGYYPQSSYPFPATYPNMQQSHPPPRSVPAATYGYFGQAPAPPLASPPAQYPQTAAYPPTIYPLTPYGGGGSQQPHQKPVFYQRIFSGGGSKKSKRGSKRSY